MEVKGKVIVVTGGASGIGEGLCRRFVQEGARGVAVVDLDGEGANKVAADIGGLGLPCDVGREEDILRVVAKTEEELGPIDMFCSNAGLAVPGGVEVSDEDWQRHWQVHVMSHVYASRAVIPGMIERGGGYLLSTASAAGLLSQIGSMPYATTKHAAVGLAENLAITYGDRGIGVSVLCPGAVRTGMTRDGAAGAEEDGWLDPEDVADIVVAALAEERFLILTHPVMKTYMGHKVSDYDRWIKGMKRLQRRLLAEGQTLS
ncbi:MAG: SDR family oxidoreductase [Proteobacteria bacterium]|nr:SDR family oxidoreductase [Pseudomonadota bacterium]